MHMACSSTSLVAARLPATKRSSPPHASSLSSGGSVLFAGGRSAVTPAARSLRPVAGRRRGCGDGTRPSSGALRCRCLFGLGVPELAVIAGVAALVFGPKKLPEIGRSIGQTVKSFQQAAKEFETELKKDPEDASKPPSSAESTKAVSNEDEKELETSGTKDST